MPVFLGISINVWGIVCLILAIIYYFLWPKPRPESLPRPVWADFVLRYLHSLVWAMLAGACFLWGARNEMWAYLFARLALIGYMVYIGVLALDRRGRFS